MILRSIEQSIIKKAFSGKAIIILAPRQSGKSTLMRSIRQKIDRKSLYLDCDDPQTRSLLHNQSTPNLIRLAGDNELIFIDEAQRVENIGLTIKQIHDNTANCQIIASGSSALELANKINEPLTGRKWTFHLYPIAFGELRNHSSWFDEIRLLETRLIYGSYPDVINNPGNEKEILNNLSESYLYKDIFTFQEVRKPQLIQKLLQLLAFQIASEVSYNELANNLQVNTRTIEKYIDLLEKAFVIFRLPALSRNSRNEIKKGKKIYFYDNGIRNSLISNFQSLDLRNDKGALWENYLVSERLKRNAYTNHFCNSYFWRTTQQQEIDYIEEYDGVLHAYEFKWNQKNNARLSKTFQNTYAEHEFIIIHKENYTGFIDIP